MSDSSLDRFRGCLLGLAIADALAAPVEGLKQGHIKDLFGKIDTYVNPEISRQNHPYRYLPSGVYTYNTQQALCLAESLVRCYGFNPEDFVRTMLQLWNAIPEFNTGAFRTADPVFKAVLSKLATGLAPFQAGEPNAGIGAGARVAPVGLYFADDQDFLLKSAIEQALITNKDPRAIALSASISYMVAQFAKGDWQNLKTNQQIDDLIQFTAQAEKTIEQEYIIHLPPRVYDFFNLFFRSIEPFRRWQGMPEELVFNQIVNLANQAFPPHKITSPNQNFALASGISAIFIAITAKNLATGIIDAINLGKETSSIGAITGAILGAKFGETQIPETWRKGLKNYDQIALRSEAIIQKSSANLKIIPLVNLETDLTRLAIQEREKFVQKMIAQGEYDPQASLKKRLAKAQQPLTPKLKRSAKKSKLRRKKTPWRTWQD